MESSSDTLQNIVAQFILLSFSYALGMGMIFLLVNLISQASPSPYTLKAFVALCVPGFLYSFLESVEEHQAWNFFGVFCCLLLTGIIQMLLIRRIPMKAYLIGGCALALLLWIMVPKALMKLF